jgi:amino acid transporter
LPLLVLYGVGITIGAGIYVLIGAVAAHAGRYAAWSFILAAAGMAFTVGSYAELATRFPVSAGEAAYVRQAFGSRSLSRLTGMTTLIVAVIASSTVAVGAAGVHRLRRSRKRGRGSENASSRHSAGDGIHAADRDRLVFGRGRHSRFSHDAPQQLAASTGFRQALQTPEAAN